MAEKASVESYRERIAKEEEKLAAIRKNELAPLEKAAEEALLAYNRKTEAVNIEKRNYDLRKAGNPFLVSILGSVFCLLMIAYYLWRSAVARFENDKRYTICIFLGFVLVGFIILAGVRWWLKKNALQKLEGVITVLEVEMNAAKKNSDDAISRRTETENRCKKLQKEIDRLTQELYLAHPEEKERVEREAKEALEKEIAEKQAQDEAYETMIAETEAKKEQLLLAEEMFDAPRKFIKKDGYQNEFEVLCASAEMGCEEAQSKLVLLYAGAEFMADVKCDPKKAIELGKQYAESRESGSPLVAETIGEIYLFGKGEIEKDAEKACYWLEKAANKGRKNAMVNLGYCLYTGEGVEQDIEKAKYWFEKAAKQGDEQAFQLLTAIESGVAIQAE